MIVDPDFLDHWKTRLVVDLLGGDELAPLYILRIWGHCQARKKADGITISAAGLRALCRCTTASAEALEAALVEAGFIERDGGEIRVIDWAVRNSKLVTAWQNGAAGGRGNAKRAAQVEAKTEPNANRNGTEPEPTGNPTGTEREAIGIRLDIEEKQKTKTARAAPSAAVDALLAAGVDQQTAADWIVHRKAKRATASATVIEDRKRVCAEAGVTLAAGLALEVSRGWQGLQAEWIRNALVQQNAARGLPFQNAQDRARNWADIATGANEDEQRIIDITPTASALLG